MGRLMVFIQRKIIRYKLNKIVKKKLGGFELLPHLISMLKRDLVGHYKPAIGLKIEFVNKRHNIEELLIHGEAVLEGLKKLSTVPREADRDKAYQLKTDLDSFLTKEDKTEIPIDIALSSVKRLAEELTEQMESIKQNKSDMHSYYSRRLEYYVTDLNTVMIVLLKVQIWEG